MSSRVLFAAVAAGLPIVVAMTTGCASGSSPHGFGGGSGGNAPHTTAAKALGTYAASASVTHQYGITQWRTFFGANQMVVTGYRADGTAARGVQFAWFAPAQGSVGHTRLTMLDGSGSVLRRMVAGGESGHLSNAQIGFIQTMRSDLAMGRQPQVRKLHPLDEPAPSYGNSPGQGPQCFEASTDPTTVLDGSGCILGAATFETVVGGLMAMGTCTQWYLDNQKANMTCASENSTYCNNDNPPTCNYGQDPSTQNPPAAPQPQCDQACICANYGVYNGMPCSQTCTDSASCGSGQECHWGSCGPAAAPADSPTNQNVSQPTPGASSSCSSGDVTTDPSTGQVGCSTSGGGASSSGGSSGGGGGSGSGSSSGTDTTGGDPTGGSSGGASSSGGSGSSGGGQCADDGASCAQDSDCCLGACGSGTCGVSGDGSSSGGSGGGSGSSSGGSCAADGNACAQDSDCCAGTCDTSSGTCGAASGSSSGGGSGSSSGGSCAADGNACAQDADCCSGTCDTSSGTCGAASGSSSGGGSGSSSGGSCAADGSACSQASDCCSGACTSGACGTGGTTCGNPGAGCAQDSDCCSGSCDTSAGACN